MYNYHISLDIDECMEGTQLCEVYDSCINTNGSYECSCNEPDVLASDGHRCLGQPTVSAIPYARNISLSWSPPNGYFLDGYLNQYYISCFTDDYNYTDALTNIDTYVGSSTNSIDIHPVIPFTNYTCCVLMEWLSNGNGHPNCTNIVTLQDGKLYIKVHVMCVIIVTAPDGPPEDVRAYGINPSSMWIEWHPPNISNGIVTQYILYIDYTNNSKIFIEYIDGLFNFYLLEFLYGYQLIGIRISARTDGGEGPLSVIVYNRTAQSIPGAVHNLDVSILSSSAANITWYPPKALNGIIISYHIELQQLATNSSLIIINQWITNSTDSLFVTATNLSPFIPYQVIVIAATIAGKGIATPFKFFSIEGVPVRSPHQITLARTSATIASCHWSPLTIEELRGFLLTYEVIYVQDTSGNCNNARESEGALSVSTTDTNILLTNLDPHQSYCFQVAASTSKGVGSFSQWQYISTFESSPFVLSIIGLYDCTEWMTINLQEKIVELQQELTRIVSSYCRCNVQMSQFHLHFACDEQINDRLTIHGWIVGTSSTSSNQMVAFLNQWKNETSQIPSVVIQSHQLNIDPNCDIYNTSTCDISSRQPMSSGVSAVLGALTSAVVVILTMVVISLAIIIYINNKYNTQKHTIKPDDRHYSITNPIAEDFVENELELEEAIELHMNHEQQYET
jgi:hypothetical protein